MGIVAADIKWYLSGGASNTDPNASLGGAISSTEVTDASLHNLFDVVTGNEASAGDTEYRCLYVKNTHGSLSWLAVFLWIQSNSTAQISLGLGTSAVGGTEQTVADESSAPAGVSFSQPSDYASGLSIGDIPSGSWKAIWVRRVVSASQTAVDNDTATPALQGDSTA